MGGDSDQHFLKRGDFIKKVEDPCSRHLSPLFLPDTEFNLNKDILSDNVPFEKPKCAPVWEPLT